MSRSSTNTEGVLNLGYGLFARLISQEIPWPLWDVNISLEDTRIRSLPIHREWDTVTKLHLCQWENSSGKYKRTSDDVTILVDSIDILKETFGTDPQILEGKTIGSTKILWIPEVSCVGLFSGKDGCGVAVSVGQWRSIGRYITALDPSSWKPPSVEFYQESSATSDKRQSKVLGLEDWRSQTMAQKLMIETCSNLVARFLKTGKRLSRSNSTTQSPSGRDMGGNFSEAFGDIRRAIREISDRQQKSVFKAAAGITNKPEVTMRDNVEQYFDQLKQKVGYDHLKYDRQFITMILSTPCLQEKITDMVLQKALDYWRTTDQC